MSQASYIGLWRKKLDRTIRSGIEYEKKGDYYRALENYGEVIREFAASDSSFESLRNDAWDRHDILFRKVFRSGSKLITIDENKVLAGFRRNDKIKRRLRKYRWNGNIGLLKEKGGREKGVICINMWDSIEYFALKYDLSRIKDDFKIIIFPSFSGYTNPVYYNYIGNDLDVYLSSPDETDYRFIKSIKTNLIPIRVGLGDMIEPYHANPQKPVYDICTVGYNDYYKNYSDLIWMLGKMKNNECLRIFFGGFDVRRINSLCKKSGLRSINEIGFYELDIWRKKLSSSRVFILNSIREGQCRALTDALFADVPVLVNESVLGLNRDFVNSCTGMYFNELNFEKKLKYIINNRSKFSPREWAMRNTGCFNAHEKLNEDLKSATLRKGETWNRNTAKFAFRYYIKYYYKKDEYLGKECMLQKYLL